MDNKTRGRELLVLLRANNLNCEESPGLPNDDDPVFHIKMTGKLDSLDVCVDDDCLSVFSVSGSDGQNDMAAEDLFEVEGTGGLSAAKLVDFLLNYVK